MFCTTCAAHLNLTTSLQTSRCWRRLLWKSVGQSGVKDIQQNRRKSPFVPFENPILESEVFFKANHLAQNEAEEQKNQEFYAWYKSQLIYFSASVFC
jgi:hypothetical protein